MLNIKDYGAVGDNIADDTVAVQAAIDACAVAGGEVYTPPGNYRLTATVWLRTGVTITGDGFASTYKAEADFRAFRAQGVSGAWINNFGMKDLRIVGSGNLAHTSNRLVEMTVFCEKGTFENLCLESAGYDGWVALRDCKRLLVRGCRVKGCKDDGINVGGDPVGTPCTDTHVEGCCVESCTHDGIHLSNASVRTTVIGCHVAYCQNGVGIYNSQKNTVIGNVMQSCGHGVRTLSGVCDYLVVSGNLIDMTTAGPGVLLAHAHANSQIVHNTLTGIFAGSDPISETYVSSGVLIADNTL